MLLSQDARSNEQLDPTGRACGFYWTEGLRGLGWAVDAVPTVKGGSTRGCVATRHLAAGWLHRPPEIRTAERLQGVRRQLDRAGSRRNTTGRTDHDGNSSGTPSVSLSHNGSAAGSLKTEGDPRIKGTPLESGGSWPKAAYGSRGSVYEVAVGMWPERPRLPTSGSVSPDPTDSVV